jgi:hypothetical protein
MGIFNQNEGRVGGISNLQKVAEEVLPEISLIGEV